MCIRDRSEMVPTWVTGDIPLKGAAEACRLSNHLANNLLLIYASEVNAERKPSESLGRLSNKLADVASEFNRQLARGDDLESVAVSDTNVLSLQNAYNLVNPMIADGKSLAVENDEALSSGLESDLSRVTSSAVLQVRERQDISQPAPGPWTTIIRQVHDELVQVSGATEEFDRVQNQLKEQMKLVILKDKEAKDLFVVKETLERRVADLQIKAERAAVLENERKRLMDKEAHNVDTIERLKAQLESSETRLKELDDELDMYKNSASLGRESTRTTTGGRRHSVQSAQLSSVAREELEALEQANARLWQENASLKGADLRRRIRRLEEQTPNLTRLSEIRRAAKQTTTLSDGQKVGVSSLVGELVTAQRELKTRLATKELVDLRTIAAEPLSRKDERLSEELRRPVEQATAHKTTVLSVLRQLGKVLSQDKTRFSQLVHPQAAPNLGETNESNKLATVRLPSSMNFGLKEGLRLTIDGKCSEEFRRLIGFA
eukprot:TRINITY_DN22358_c0_g1_i1.p1 TRINITY_DN22358_c0_g1~~TRINITY_DN22358_c0_g1_i1.p1  ORF type:complete len:491 (-),score=164.51 TRINITY_DN22358_c0_g1_i1:99-1571(-)